MKKSKLKIIAPVAISVILSGCGGATNNSAQSSQNSSVNEAVLGSIAQNLINNNNQSSESSSSAVNAVSTISGLIGKLTNSLSSSSSIVGTWSYTQPTIQFESENLLAKAGGSLASQTIVNKIEPYYKKLGIDSGMITLVFNENNSCTYTFKGKEYKGTYEYDNKTNSLIIKSSTGINIVNAYATVSSNEMAIAFDTSKLLTFIQNVSNISSNSTLTTISTLSKSFNGMKSGFLFTKR